MEPFRPIREDGRSNRRVIFELVRGAEPETLFSYDDLTAALNAGLPPDRAGLERKHIYQAVRLANKDLLREEKRYLQVVEGRGYKVCRASEHLPVALQKKRTAEHYFQHGIEVLRHVRMDELDDNQRRLHEGQLMILSGLYESVRVADVQRQRQEGVIQEILGRMKRIEEKMGEKPEES